MLTVKNAGASVKPVADEARGTVAAWQGPFGRKGASMAIESDTPNLAAVPSANSALSGVYEQGIVAGILGAATIAVWFFFIDFFNGRSFYTPNVLGIALFRGGVGLDQPQDLPISLEMVLVYTWVHGLIFCAIGGLVSKLLDLAERNVHAGFGILLLFVIFEFGFVGAGLIIAEPILRALAWPSVLIGNLLAAIVIAVYFWRHHPRMKISP
jgi:hypothetical protein